MLQQHNELWHIINELQPNAIPKCCAGFLIMCKRLHLYDALSTDPCFVYVYISGLQKRCYEFTFPENLINRRTKRNAYNRFAQIELVGDDAIITLYRYPHLSICIHRRIRNVCVHVIIIIAISMCYYVSN